MSHFRTPERSGGWWRGRQKTPAAVVGAAVRNVRLEVARYRMMVKTSVPKSPEFHVS
jgi:hypothetical protein